MVDRTRIEPLHALYQAMSGLSVPLSVGMHYTWEAWMLRGFTDDDLRLTIEFLRRKIKEGRKTLACLRFSTFIGNTDYFAEDLAEARALSRRPPIDTGRREALRSSGREATPPTPDAKPVRDVIAGNKALKELLRLRDSL